ncbi:glycosyltransferase family 52 [Acinetobacter sp. KS-LM10]|uniref:glycosyltransferase family 52 n=1 Tax=Acinetobacter sp. KS-LM10 TaxID=3120518 RepID=UPI0030CBE108
MGNPKQESTSLIMCVTPLQMLIAERIIDLHSDRNFDLLVMVLNDNEKYEYYYDRLKKKCLSSIYYIPKSGLFGFFDFIKNLKKNNLNKNYKELYLASIDSRHFQYIVSKNFLNSIYTFDDGTANIISSSLYYSNTQPPKLKQFIWRFLGVKHYMKDIKKRSQLHYTLYRNVPNIIANTKYISLLPQVKSDCSGGNRIVKFYLGQPLTEIDEKFTHNFVLSKLERLKLSYYFPHPREDSYPNGEFEIIESPLVFEDYIVQYLLENQNVKVEVYSFISSALLNIKELERVEVIYIADHFLLEKYKDFYLMVKNKFDISVLKID